MKHTTKARLYHKVNHWQYLIANHLFNDFFYTGDLNQTCEKITLYTPIIEKLIEYYNDTEYTDYRTGYETYGYHSIERIESRLNYISDRFCVAFRLNWLLNVPKEVQRLQSL